MALLLCSDALIAGATSRPAPPQTRPAGARTSDKLSVTEHELSIEGQALRYRATTGYLPIKDESGRERANFFFIAYEKLPVAAPASRRITFVFNGGPGAAAVWLHLGALGPKRVALRNAQGDIPVPPYKLVSNPQTWLDLTDLVFIDPVGTGYSRPAAGESGQQFYGVREDVASVADFIRLYITRYERWLSPKFLAGESYGTARAAALSEFLLDRYGIALNGIVLISCVLNFQTIQLGDGNDLPCPLYLPTYAAIAWFHGKLSGDLQKDLEKTLHEVEQFASGEYAAALNKGSALGADEQKWIVDRLSRYTGLPGQLVARCNLRISPDTFRREILSDVRQIVGRYDGRIVGFDLHPIAGWVEYDPSLSGYLPAYSATFNDYVRRDLHYENDLPYEALTDRVHPWNFARGGARGNAGYLNVTEDLRSAMAKLPHLKVLVAAGYFDLATPYMSANYTVNHLDLSPALRANVVQTYYRGGHMLYHNQESLVKLKLDAKAFIENAVSGK